jgi:hypothetical protein
MTDVGSRGFTLAEADPMDGSRIRSPVSDASELYRRFLDVACVRFPHVTCARYWHGGQSGLKVGEYILPPVITGARKEMVGFGRRWERSGCVYVTTEHRIAIVHAALHESGGTVYTVDPVGDVLPDTEHNVPGASWICNAARILEANDVPDGTRQWYRHRFRELSPDAQLPSPTSTP